MCTGATDSEQPPQQLSPRRAQALAAILFLLVPNENFDHDLCHCPFHILTTFSKRFPDKQMHIYYEMVTAQSATKSELLAKTDYFLSRIYFHEWPLTHIYLIPISNYLTSLNSFPQQLKIIADNYQEYRQISILLHNHPTDERRMGWAISNLKSLRISLIQKLNPALQDTPIPAGLIVRVAKKQRLAEMKLSLFDIYWHTRVGSAPRRV